MIARGLNSIRKPALPDNAGKVVRGALRLFIPSMLLLLTVMVLHYWIYTDTESVSLEEKQSIAVELSRSNAAANLSYLMDEVRFLGEHFRYLMERKSSSIEHYNDISHFVLSFSKHKQWYDQIRLLDVNGREVVRINNAAAGPLPVPDSELQDKSHRYYFDRMRSLEADEVYLSPLDLNVESAQVEQPFKPTIRIGIALFDEEAKRLGYLLANYRGDDLIANFQQVSSHLSDRMMLVNSEGYWLVGGDDGKNWGFMLDHQDSFAEAHPIAWQQINSNTKGQLVFDQGLYSFDTLFPYVLEDTQNRLHDDAKSYYWKVISFAPNRLINEAPREFLGKMVPAYLVALIILLASAFVISSMRMKTIAIQEQRNYERSFRRALEDIELAALIMDVHGKIIFCNEHFARTMGYSRHRLLEMEWIDLLPDSDHRSGDYTVFLRNLMDQQLEEHVEQWLVDAHQNQHLFSWTNTFAIDEHGQVSSLICLGRNITKQRQIETELRKLSMAVEQSPNIVMITDTNGCIEYVNPRFVEVTGYQYDEVIGKQPSIVSSGETLDEEYQELWEKIQAGETWQGVLKNKKKNGVYYWEKTTISPIFDINENITHYLSVKDDITEKRKLKVMLEQQEEENRKNRELAAVGTMANMVAHDLRNPLSSIKMALQILMRERSAAMGDSYQQEEELIGISQEQVRYMEGILRDLMDYSGTTRLSPEWLQLDKVLELTINSLQKQIYQQGIQLDFKIEKGLPTLYADANKLRQVFSNLITNSIQALAAQADAKLTISTGVVIVDGTPKVQVVVTDNGVGFDPCMMGNVFEPFYTSKEKGTGLGLAIARQLVEKHEGSIRLELRASGGVVAKVILPVAPASMGVLQETAVI
ncbi:PAS domain S-box protein [Aestuariirhabdus sp. Z084]|uniref:PAS domain S-box protein n=1 Tax=Aestuariirhabdus haliotis TaxID=2918751 RepID=UPI00201B3579|nr:PAS domain S-box protein [Aestuariirhabdus haliotis]MCL6416551.1 PAS domain S-box protein [Aestuariirhabdus haliotis]MCL6420582.1 PAS domain S-box protein [Aestuariirhabdus haliotis]